MAMKDEIKLLATRLFTLHGFRGVSYGDIAQALGITTTNIHYHFGNKLNLAAEVLDEYVAMVIARTRSIWTDPATSLREKIDGTVAFHRESYTRLNPAGDEGHPWSLITRFTADSDILNDRMRQRIAGFRRDINACVRTGLDLAIEAGEVAPDLPRGDVARLITSCFLYSNFITRDTGTFAGLERHYRAQFDLLMRAWGVDPAATPRLAAAQTY